MEAKSLPEQITNYKPIHVRYTTDFILYYNSSNINATQISVKLHSEHTL